MLDAESWYSVTPENIAAHVARRLAAGLHRHGSYLVANSNMAGFSRRQQALLAALVETTVLNSLSAREVPPQQ